MSVQVIGDSIAKLSDLRSLLSPHFPVRTELFRGERIDETDTNAIIVAMNLRDLDSVFTLKNTLSNLTHIKRRIFVIDDRARASIMQAYALGATHVLTHPLGSGRLLAALRSVDRQDAGSQNAGLDQQASALGAACIADMFKCVLGGQAVDLDQGRKAGKVIADAVAEQGLTKWLSTVRSYHEGTYQHCLLVTGVAVDFGLALGMREQDIERLYTAAMFHDIGKAAIPLAVLDKPGKLDAKERLLIETHPGAGYDILKKIPDMPAEVLDGVRHHHEYLDGSGYPDALVGENISDVVRILTISDVFAALIERRAYKKTMSREQAYDIILGMKGKLEEALVKAFRNVALVR